MNFRNKYFSSIVNEVRLIEKNGRIEIRKEYLPISKVLKIPLPMKRCDIECRVLRLLRDCIKNDISVRIPEIYSRIGNIVDMEYVKGKNLLEMGCMVGRIDPDVWRQFGFWLRNVEIELFDRRSEIFFDAWEAQDEISKIIGNLKTPLYSNMDVIFDSVSLGDMGLSNVIIKEDILFPIDFEFCHLSFAGRDIAQIVTQMEVLYSDRMDISVSMAYLIYGYIEAGGELLKLNLWCNNFKGYYVENFKEHKRC